MSSEATGAEHFEVDTAVIGAGVVGCATALALAERGRSVAVLEANSIIADGVTSRNSGVIHAAIYYPPGSLKARLCLRGKELLYAFAAASEVSHKRTGKLIVAKNNAQLTELEAIFANAKASGATGLKMLEAREVAELEPGIACKAALHSSETGIIDPVEFAKALLNQAENNGAVLVTHCKVRAIERCLQGYKLDTTRGLVRAQSVVNAAGLQADEIAAMAGVTKYRIYPWRGDYFTFRPAHRYSQLIYPVKEKGSPGLGVHLTIDLSGNYRLGPDVEYLGSRTDFGPAEHKLEKFRQAAENLFGPVSAAQLSYDTCGIRPKLRAPDETKDGDFVVAQDLPGFVNLVGIESPGLTSALALAELVREMLA